VKESSSPGIEMAEPLRVESPAKVNLSLEILKKRADGYHEIRTLLQKINLSDSLIFSTLKGKRIVIETDHPGLPTGRRNLVYRAAESILGDSAYRDGVLIRIEKRIPLGAGLGGGSSNAAATLTALNRLLNIPYSKRRLMRMGLEIGADVPFFLFDGDAIGSGIGERLKRVELPELWYVLIYPNFEVSTRWAYQNFVLTNKKSRFNLHQLSTDPEDFSRILKNDLEEVVEKKYPQVGSMKEVLLSAGARGASMTGSGPTVFGIFPDERGASEAHREIEERIRRKDWTVFLAGSIRVDGHAST
jgi:4-diphosphocytidyl-2-C-methyl-D-erythritol kinase